MNFAAARGGRARLGEEPWLEEEEEEFASVVVEAVPAGIAVAVMIEEAGVTDRFNGI